MQTVVVGSGSGDFMLDTVRGTDADVYLTSDLRHHRAGEFLEHGGPALVDVAHWAAEWTWLPVVERKLLDAPRRRGGYGGDPGQRASSPTRGPSGSTAEHRTTSTSSTDTSRSTP